MRTRGGRHTRRRRLPASDFTSGDARERREPFAGTLASHLARWYLLPRLLALMDGPLGGKGLALGPGVGWETLAPFDFAYELNVLHHIRDYPAAIREVRRVLKPGGRFFLQDLSRHQLFPPESLFTRAELVWQLEAAATSSSGGGG